MRKLSSFAFLLFTFQFLSAQEFGGNPPSIKWKQIDTDTARIIFPEGLDSAAQRVAAVVHFLASKNNSLGSSLRKINIVLQNQTTIANGYVGLGPFRSEMMMTPSPNNFDLGSIDWATSLAVHEYRHVQQFNSFRRGLSHVMYYLFGEEGLALAINASVPDWFYEGDAVYNETVHTQQGRGRIPFFTNQYQALWLAKKNYSWMKLRNGSLKDYVPNHYPLGYLLVNYGYEKYGSDFWKKVTQDAAAFKGLFYPFQKAIKKHAGVDYKTFRRDAFAFYKDLHQTSPGGGGLNEASLIQLSYPTNQVKKDTSELQLLNPPSPAEDKAQSRLRKMNGASQEKLNQGTEAGEQKITKPTLSHVTNYFFPYRAGDDSMIYLKSSYRRRSAFVVKDYLGEHVLRVKDISPDEQFGYRSGKIVYAAYKPDARWGWRDYSEIKLLDVKSGEQRRVTRRTKYFSPDISPDGKTIAAVHVDASGVSELHFIDAKDGTAFQRVKNADVHLFTNPKFISGHSVITALRLRDGRMALAWVDQATGLLVRLTPPTYRVIGYPFASGDKIYFTAAYGGNDELFLYDIPARKIYRLTEGLTGRYFVSMENDVAVYSVFTAGGYQLAKLDMKHVKMQEVDSASWVAEAGGWAVAGEKDFEQLQLANLPPGNYAVHKYRKGTRLLNFHSWRPYYEDPIFTYSLYGENVLNTLQTELYYLYNRDERTNAVGLSTVYGAWFPYVSAGMEYTISRTDTLNNLTRQWNQLDSRVGLNFPFNFSGGRFFRFLNFGSSYVLRMENNTGPNKNLFVENTFSYLSHFVSYRQQVQMARQHIFPKFGFSASLQQRHAISTYDSYQFYGSSNLYLPGLFSTHSFFLNYAFQQRDTFRLLFSNRFPYSRGYNELYFSRMWKLAGNYHFPLWIPDRGFANILYIERLRANVFYDFTRVYSRNKKVTRDQRSVGAELYADTKWWNQYPLTFGVRFSRRLDADLLTGNKGTYFEFVLPVSIIPR